MQVGLIVKAVVAVIVLSVAQNVLSVRPMPMLWHRCALQPLMFFQALNRPTVVARAASICRFAVNLYVFLLHTGDCLNLICIHAILTTVNVLMLPAPDSQQVTGM